MRPLAELRFEQIGDVTVARLTGEVDVSNAEELRRSLVDSVPNDAAALVLDLSEVRYLDSSGVQLMFTLSRQLDRRQQQLHVVVPAQSPIWRVLDHTQLAATTPVHLLLDEAMAAAKKRSGTH